MEKFLALDNSKRSILQRLGWPKWVGLALVILFILELFLVCGNASLFNVVMAFVPDAIRPVDPNAPPNAVNDLAFSPDGTMLVTATSDGKLHIWQLPDASLKHTIEASSRPLSSTAFSPDGTLLAAASWDGSVQIWRVDDISLVYTLSHDNPVRSIAFSPDGDNLAIGAWDGVVTIWTLRDDGASPRRLNGHTDWISRVAYSPDGTLLASASNDGTLRLWNSADGSIQHTITTHPNPMLNMAFSPDGRSIAASVFERGLQIWQVPSGETISIISQLNPVWSMAVSPSGRWLASGTNGGWRLWHAEDTAPWQVQTTPYFEQPYQSALLSMAFSPDNAMLAIGSRDGRVMLMDVSAEGVELIAEWAIE